MSSEQALVTTTRALSTKMADIEKKLTVLEISSASNKVKLDSYESRLDALEKAKEHADSLALVTAAESDAQAKQIDYLQSILQVSNAANQVKLPPGVFDDGEEGVIDTSGEGDEDNVGPLSQADILMEKDPSLRKATLHSLEHLSGVPHFRDLENLIYPQVAEDHPDWPSSSGPNGQKLPLMRLDFSKPFSEAKNWQRVQTWADHIIENGATHTPEAATILGRVSRRVVLAGCRYRFKYLKGELQKKLKAAREAGNRNNAQVDENTGPVDPPVVNLVADDHIDPFLHNQVPATTGPDTYPETPLSDLRSRAKGKCEMRSRQRKGLTEEYKEFKEPKYDSFFTPGAQSDDETEYKFSEGAWIKTGKFISRAPEFWLGGGDLLWRKVFRAGGIIGRSVIPNGGDFVTPPIDGNVPGETQQYPSTLREHLEQEHCTISPLCGYRSNR
ncbi:hypothetical protein RSAG8_12970, partial [Rhizoctonia solani AG-8 WAC10335]